MPRNSDDLGADSADGLLRLNKAIAMAGVCSRRAADELISRGEVRVNGEVVSTPGVRIDPAKDAVLVRGNPIALKTQGAARRTVVMLNKPTRVVTTAKDPQGRRTVLDLLPDSLRRERLFPVGRLDFFSEGLLLLTNDGDLAYRLTHPSHHLPKFYEVLVRGNVSEHKLETMRKGMTLSDGERLAPVRAEVLKHMGPDRALLGLTLIQGVNRQIRRMLADLDLTVLTLRRIKLGPLRLGALGTGEWRYLTGSEEEGLRAAVGLKRRPHAASDGE